MSGSRFGLLSIAVVTAFVMVFTSGNLAFAKKLVPGQAGGRPLYATLTGAAEVPGPGDPDGSGSAVVTLNQGEGLVCFDVQFSGIDPIRAAHIHEAPVGVQGGVVVNFGVTGTVADELVGCVSADAELIKAIRQNPENYYVNVHNEAFPGGALRGQLSK